MLSANLASNAVFVSIARQVLDRAWENAGKALNALYGISPSFSDWQLDEPNSPRHNVSKMRDLLYARKEELHLTMSDDELQTWIDNLPSWLANDIEFSVISWAVKQTEQDT